VALDDLDRAADDRRPGHRHGRGRSGCGDCRRNLGGRQQPDCWARCDAISERIAVAVVVTWALAITWAIGVALAVTRGAGTFSRRVSSAGVQHVAHN